MRGLSVAWAYCTGHLERSLLVPKNCEPLSLDFPCLLQPIRWAFVSKESGELDPPRIAFDFIYKDSVTWPGPLDIMQEIIDNWQRHFFDIFDGLGLLGWTVTAFVDLFHSLIEIYTHCAIFFKIPRGNICFRSVLCIIHGCKIGCKPNANAGRTTVGSKTTAIPWIAHHC